MTASGEPTSCSEAGSTRSPTDSSSSPPPASGPSSVPGCFPCRASSGWPWTLCCLAGVIRTRAWADSSRAGWGAKRSRGWRSRWLPASILPIRTCFRWPPPCRASSRSSAASGVSSSGCGGRGGGAGGRALEDAKGASGARWSLFVTFADGMEELTRALASRLPAGAIRLGHRVASVTREGEGWRVGMTDGSAALADGVIIATESHQAARMVRYTDPGLSHLLEGIPYASSATVTLAWRRVDILHALDGFGFVVPQVERRSIIACTFSSVKYARRAPEGFALLRVFLGGALNEAALEGDDETLTRAARAELGDLLGIQAPPLWSRVSRYPKAMPQYHVGHVARIDAIEGCLRAHPGLALAGGAYRGVGIADCVRSAEEAAARLLAAHTKD